MSEVVLTGLDGKNPLAFLAALGAFQVLTEHARSRDEEVPKLYWRVRGTTQPVLVGVSERAALIDILSQDAAALADEPALDLRYKKNGDGAEAHDLKPPPGEFARHLRRLIARGERRGLDIAAALATDVALDNGGNTKPTALHFTAGQQQFLAMVDELRQGITSSDLDEALFGPWKYARSLPVLQWDNSQARDYALRATDPSKDKKLGVPGADWLAFRGLTFVRVAPVGDAIVTTGCAGGWKSGTFRWPIWSAPVTAPTVRGLLVSKELFDVDASVLRARGVAIVFESSIGRSDQGGYGSFAPARVAQPTRR